MLWRICVCIAFTSLFLAGCASGAESSPKFDDTIFKNDQYSVTLGFDLRSDEHPVAGLIINGQVSATPSLKTIVLPFSSSHAESNEKLFSSSGSFNDTSIINYYFSPTSVDSYSIGFIPAFQPSPERYTNPDDAQSSVTLVRMGLERIFVYKYPDVDSNRKNWQQKEGALANTQIDAIGVAYPKDAKSQEIRDTGLTAIPVAFPYRNGKARFYPADGKLAGQEALEVKYILPENLAQTIFVEYIIKLFIIALAPIIKMVISNPKGRNRIVANILIGIQVIIFISLIVYFVMFWRGLNIKAIFDLLIALIGNFLAGYVLLQEKKDKSTT